MEKKKISSATLKKIVIGLFAFIIIVMSIVIPIVGHRNKQYRFSFDGENYLGKKDLTNYKKFEDFDLIINYEKHDEPIKNEDDEYLNGEYEFVITYKKDKVTQNTVSAKFILIYPKDKYESNVKSITLTHDKPSSIKINYNNPNPKKISKDLLLYIEVQYTVSIENSSTTNTIYFRVPVTDTTNK